MKNTIQKTIPHLSKVIILFSFLLIAFTVGDGRSEYLVPIAAVAVYSADLDLDGDKDIITGHNYFIQTQWGGGLILENYGNGYFNINDSIFFDHGLPVIHGNYFDNNNYIDFYGRHQNGAIENIVIIYNYGLSQFDSIKVFFTNDDSNVSDFADNDVDGDGDNDIVFSCNNDYFWGIIYNDGTGNFSAPVYFDLDYPPLDIACADLNDDGRSDVVITDYIIEVYFSTETGFEQQLLGYAIPWSSGYKILPSDFDNDGDIDVIVTAKSNSNHSNVYMFENLGHKQFYEHPYFEFNPFCSYAQIADFNNDSLPDMVFVASDHSGLYIYNNIGDFIIEYQQFIPYQRTNPKGLFCEDYDKNGFIDIAFTSGVGGIDYYLNILFNDGMGNFVDDPVGIIEKEEKQKSTLLCYPNPFTDRTTISINLNKNEKIKLEIYDIKGKLIKTFIDDKLYTEVYKIIWNGDDLNGKEIEAGIYFVRLISGRNIYSQKLVFSK